MDRGILTPLNSYLEQTEGFSTADFFPRLLDRYTYDDVVYGIPYDAQPMAILYYNPAMCEEAGLPAPTNQWSWEDMLAAAQALTVRDGGTISRYGLVLGSKGPIWPRWDYFLYVARSARGWMTCAARSCPCLIRLNRLRVSSSPLT